MNLKKWGDGIAIVGLVILVWAICWAIVFGFESWQALR